MELFIKISICAVGLALIIARFRSRPPFALDSEAVEDWAMKYFPDESRGIAVLAANTLIRQTGVSLEELSPASRFNQELKAYYYFKSVGYFRALEEQFGTVIGPEAIEQIPDFGTLVNFLRDCPKQRASDEPVARHEHIRLSNISKPIQMRPLVNP